MQLPNREHAYVPKSKLEDYLLSETHIVGRTKARLLRMFGFDLSDIDFLEKSLLAIAHTQKVSKVVLSPHGRKFIIDGLLQTPKKRSLKI